MESLNAAASLGHETLLLWERAVNAGASRRADALLHFAGDAPRGLGVRNLGLLGLRAKLFGASWPLRSDCPACGCICEFVVDCVRLASEMAATAAPDKDEHELLIEGCPVRFRVPGIEDLHAIPDDSSVEGATAILLKRCILQPGIEQLPTSAHAVLSQKLETLDPAASLSFEVICSECEHKWDAPIDVASALWSEIQVAAERTLLEVDALARSYGWSESQILALSPTRRAAYLQLAGAA